MSEHDNTAEQIAQLKEEIAILKEAIQYLAFSKQTEPRFAYFDWLVKNAVLGEKQARFNVVLTTLSIRLAGDTPEHDRPIAGVSSELLYKDGRPAYQEAEQLLMQVLDTRNETAVEELFQAMRMQGMHGDLVALWEASKPLPKTLRS